MLRRLYHEQPAAFAFTPANLAWAKGQISKYPEGRQASAIIPLLWRAQEQEGWLSRPAIEHVADMLGMAHIRALEVATFYFMFQLQPVGSVAHIQICGTTSCMICGSGALIAVCKDRIAAQPHTLSADGKFSWEEVECLGSCANAPMAQIGKDYYEDLTAARLGQLLDDLAAGKVPVPGPQTGRYSSEPANGLTSLKEFESGRTKYNASVQRAVDIGDTVKRIDGTEVPLLTPWLGTAAPAKGRAGGAKAEKPAKAAPPAKSKAAEAPAPAPVEPAAAAKPKKPRALKAPRKGGADDLKMIKGVGPKLEALLHSLGFYHFDQVAGWTAAELAWVDDSLEGFRGRASRDGWIEQAKLLAGGGETEFSKRVKKGNVY
ncbi:MAG: NADH-quinone oxidoreductase subunit E [Rhodobacterales bacterium 32-67-9]|nr:MAG: NADH-quinone oxidoreductase subunit E [Rhodobacterales bacterium 32-67-9]